MLFYVILSIVWSILGINQGYTDSYFQGLSCYHNQSCCDGLFAAVAVFSITGPVVLLTVELSLSFIVPVRQDAATFTTPREKWESGKERERVVWQNKGKWRFRDVR